MLDVHVPYTLRTKLNKVSFAEKWKGGGFGIARRREEGVTGGGEGKKYITRNDAITIYKCGKCNIYARTTERVSSVCKPLAPLKYTLTETTRR